MHPNADARPTRQQLAWQDLELGLFCHFGLNTFTDREWGDGTDSPADFNPSQLDAGQWVRTAKQAGFRYFILTAKHHDGFCLWPTATTDYSVKSSPWGQGRGDVVRDCAEACEREGLAFGLYLSPWDRHEPCYSDKEAYDEFYIRQLTELLTGYGELAEIWFDGAGSEGRDYDWPRIMEAVRTHQPDANIFNMGAPTIRWVGNEDGVAPYPCWNSGARSRLSLFTEEQVNWLPETPDWLPAECDVPMRKGHWFWHPDDEHNLLSLKELMRIYCESVGRGANLLLNASPDRRGLIPELDTQRLLEFGAEIRRCFGQPLASTSGIGFHFELALPGPSRMDHVILMEEIADGERIHAYTLEALCDSEWVRIAEGSAVGHKRIEQFAPVVASACRLTIRQAAGQPRIRSFAVYLAGERETD